jgi:hypothetical protein
MKVCPKCGTPQSDNRFLCIDCGEKLGKPVSQNEEADMKRKTEKTLDRLYNKSDPLYVSMADKIIGALGFAGMIVVVILLTVFKSHTPDIWKVGAMNILLFLICSINALFPKVLWELEQIRMSALINEADDATPTDLYFIVRKAVTYVNLIIGVALLILTCICL